MKLLYTDNWNYVVDTENNADPGIRYFIGSNARGRLCGDINTFVNQFNLEYVGDQNMEIPAKILSNIEEASNNPEKIYKGLI